MNLPDLPFKLTQADKGSPVWGALMGHWAKRIEQLRSQLEGDIPEMTAAKIRGRIAEVRACMALDKEFPAAPD